jgi:hypothetical protein
VGNICNHVKRHNIRYEAASMRLEDSHIPCVASKIMVQTLKEEVKA